MRIKESPLIEKIKNTDFAFVAKECALLEYEKIIEKNNKSPYEGMIYSLLSPIRFSFHLISGYGLLKAMKNIGQ